MKINANSYSIAEILGMLDRRELVVNREYQRGSALWPNSARSYFIDTILEDFPFPKIYFYEFIDRRTQELRKELVDGQQRITTIHDFRQNRFQISGDSSYAGMKFQDLSEEKREHFLSYPVSADVIRNARRPEILQMFRRMNAYTLPLNSAEKRHSTFQGEFKWFLNSLSDEMNDFFLEFGVLTSRQIVRMADAEFLAEIIHSVEEGISSSSPAALTRLYKKYEDQFERGEEYSEAILAAVEEVTVAYSRLAGTYMAKPYAMQTLLLAIMFRNNDAGVIHNQFAIIEPIREEPSPIDIERKLMELAFAHETKEVDGQNRVYVWGASGGTNRIARRSARFISQYRALTRNEIVPCDDSIIRSIPV